MLLRFLSNNGSLFTIGIIPAWIPFKLCETEHFLYWGVLHYSKSGLVALTGEYFGTDGRLRFSGASQMTILQLRQTQVKEFQCGFLLYDTQFSINFNTIDERELWK